MQQKCSLSSILKTGDKKKESISGFLFVVLQYYQISFTWHRLEPEQPLELELVLGPELG